MTTTGAPAIAVVIPALNAARHLRRCVASLGEGVDIFVIDGGSVDTTVAIAKELGATVVSSERGRGIQLCKGARHALQTSEAAWLLFLHADTALQSGWRTSACAFMSENGNRSRAAVFRFGLDDDGPEARRLAAMVDWRVRWLALPYGDQGLLIHRDAYIALGGYTAMPLMEDVDIIRRIGRRRLTVLEPAAITSAERWRREGWIRRSSFNVVCLGLYYIGVPPRHIKRLYG